MMCFSLSVWYTYECTKNPHSDLIHVFHGGQVYVPPPMLSGTVTGLRSVDVGFDNQHGPDIKSVHMCELILVGIRILIRVRHYRSPAPFSLWNIYQISTTTTSLLVARKLNV
jgi:hypothetical protein